MAPLKTQNADLTLAKKAEDYPSLKVDDHKLLILYRVFQ